LVVTLVGSVAGVAGGTAVIDMAAPAFRGMVSEDGKKLILDYPEAFKAYYARFKGDEVEVEIRKRRTKRSDRQNRAFHAMVMPWAKDEGHSIDALKRDLLAAIFGLSEKTSPLSGQPIPNIEHTSDLDVQQFNELIERTMEIAASCGYVLEAPDEYKARKGRAA
jgi:hypothetical protein